MLSNNDKFSDDFPYTANELDKYIRADNLFTIMLKNREIVHYTTNDKVRFDQWLKQNNVSDIR